MRIVAALFVACLAVGCKPVNFAKREGLSVIERARAIGVLHANAHALNVGDFDAMERTLHPDSTAGLDNARELVERLAPTVFIRGVKVVSEKPRQIVVRYEQSIEVKNGMLPSVTVHSTLLHNGSRWQIFSTQPVR